MKINREKIENFLKLLMVIFALILTYLVAYLVATNNIEKHIYVNEQDNKKEEVSFSNRLIEKSTVNIKCDSTKLGKKTYYNYNKDFNFKVEIMNNWEVKEYYNYDFYNITFGPEYSIGGGMWGISIYPITFKQESDIIKTIGSQFKDKNENIIVINDITKKIIVTTEEKKDWFSETYLIKKGKFIFEISNGAVKNEDFSTFFDSLEFVN